MNKPQSNYAFIDGQNFYQSVRSIGVQNFDFRRFRVYLSKKHGVGIAYYFIGYITENKPLYSSLEAAGFELVFKEVAKSYDKYKGNVDVNLTVKAMSEIDRYSKAVIVTSDGDYACLAEYLIEKNKLGCLIGCSRNGCSHLLRKLHVMTRIFYMDDIVRDLDMVVKRLL